MPKLESTGYKPKPKADKAKSKADCMLLAELLKAESSFDLMSKKDRDFAESLLQGQWGYFTRGFITESQHGWVQILLQKLMFPGEEPPIPEALKTPKMIEAEIAKKANRGKTYGNGKAAPKAAGGSEPPTWSNTL